MYTLENFGVEFKETSLKNGSSLFLFKKQGAPIYIRASINAGTRWNDIPGIAHFVEHMVIAGSKKFPSKNLLASEIEKMGGQISAFTNFDSIALNVQVAQESDFSIATDVLNEMLCNSLFDPKIVENEKGAIFSEIRTKRSNPRQYAFDLFFSLIFQDTYMKYPILGNEESVKNITTDDLIKFYRNFFSSSRVTYIACGDIEIETLKRSLENTLQTTNLVANSLPLVPEIITEKRISTEYFENQETHLIFGFRTDTQSLEEKTALFAIVNMLAVGRASILTTELRYKRGLVYGTSGTALFFSGVGMFNILTSCSEKNVQKTLDIIYEQVDKIYENGINEEAFDFVKRKILKSKFIEMQTAHSWVNGNDQYLNTLAVEKSNIVNLMNILENITPKKASEIFKKYIKKGGSYLVVCGRNKPDSLELKY